MFVMLVTIGIFGQKSAFKVLLRLQT